MIIEEAELQDIIDEYVRELPHRFQHLVRCLSEFENTAAQTALVEAISQAHRLRGTGKVFGQDWVSDIAGHVEDNLKAVNKELLRKGTP
jgi:hypothetical protein